jgi:hypothetical protein
MRMMRWMMMSFGGELLPMMHFVWGAKGAIYIRIPFIPPKTLYTPYISLKP